METGWATNQTKSMMKKIVDIFNSGDLKDVSLLFSQNYIAHQNDSKRSTLSKGDGPEEFERIVIGARKSLPNLKVTLTELFGEEDKIVARLLWESEDEIGNKIARETIDILHIRGGKITEHWGAEEWISKHN